MAYTGRCIWIDLTAGSCEIRESEKELQKKFIGAKGMGFALLEKYAPAPDPLGPENPLIFINGPFTGTKVQTSSRTTAVTRSPLTGSAQDCHCGGSFGPRLKYAGYDYVFITGQSQKPVYLYINEGKVDLIDASDLWGKGIFETDDILRNKHKGHDPRVAAIGQAGENLSFMSCIGVDKHRQFGRGGIGAVMGSKKLKAVIVDGNIAPVYADEEKFKELNLNFTKEVLALPGIKFRRLKGTMKCVRGCQDNEMLPVHNFQQVQSAEFEKISSETCRQELNWEDTGCFNCSIRCSKWARWDGHEIEGPEYETTAFLGSMCDIYNIKDVAWANEMCNDLGFDTISCGSTISFAMECYEKGLVDNWDGLELTWGNSAAQRDLINKMAFRKGIGDLFTDGTRAASRKIGKGSEAFAGNVFGMELSGINPMGSLTMGIAMSVADFSSHTRLWIAEQEMGPDFKIEDIVPTVADGIDTTNVRNSLVVCDFLPLSLDKLADLLNAITGSNYTGKDLSKIGTAITHMARRYNLRNGRTAEDDILPDRFFNETSLAGFMRGKKVEKSFFRGLIRNYYQLRKWNEKGEPQKELLKEYDLI
jgi:aldehyde:ferredoxin oxidoreductase